VQINYHVTRDFEYVFDWPQVERSTDELKPGAPIKIIFILVHMEIDTAPESQRWSIDLLDKLLAVIPGDSQVSDAFRKQLGDLKDQVQAQLAQVQAQLAQAQAQLAQAQDQLAQTQTQLAQAQAQAQLALSQFHQLPEESLLQRQPVVLPPVVLPQVLLPPAPVYNVSSPARDSLGLPARELPKPGVDLCNTLKINAHHPLTKYNEKTARENKDLRQQVNALSSENAKIERRVNALLASLPPEAQREYQLHFFGPGVQDLLTTEDSNSTPTLPPFS